MRRAGTVLRSRWPGAVTLACALLASAGPARATVVADTPLPDMVAGADAIVQGRVVRVGQRVVLTDAGYEPQRLVWIRVGRWLKRPAEAAPAEVVLREPGGTLAGLTYAIEGVARYRAGEEVIAFLESDGAGGFRTMNLALGKFAITRAKEAAASYVARDVHGITIAAWREGDMELRAAEAEPPMQLDTFVRFVDTVLSALRRAGGRP